MVSSSADALIYHPAVSHFNRFVATTVGRDKALRTAQYLSRFLAWYLLRTNHPQTTVATFETIKKQFGTARKAMRIGKFVEHLKAAAVAADNKALDPVLKFLAISRQLGYAAYLTLDMLCYFDSTGIRKAADGKLLQKRAAQAWFVGLLSNWIAGVYTLYGLRLRAKQLQTSEDAEKKVTVKTLEKEQTATITQLISDSSDILLPSATIGWLDLDDGVLGLAGTTSSLIGLRSAWRKTA